MTTTKDAVYQFMLDYQAEHVEPPTMAEIQERFEALAYRSSVRYVMNQLVEDGRVEDIGLPGSPRRYQAVAPDDTEPGKQLTDWIDDGRKVD